MGLFSKYRPHYTEPERYSPEVARERRLSALLEKERRFLDVPNFPRKLEEQKLKVDALSRANNAINALNKIKNNDAQARRQKAGMLTAAMDALRPKITSAGISFENEPHRAAYVQLQERLKQHYAQEKALRDARKSSPSGANKSYYNPTGKDFASTIYGQIAGLHNKDLNAGWVQVFKNPSQVVPCIERHVRRSVMFAKGHAGKGWHTKKRRTWSSGVPC